MSKFLLKGPLIIILGLCLNVHARALKVPDIQVMNEKGVTTSLSHTMGKQSLLILGFYQCHHMCDFIVQNLTKSLQGFKQYPQVTFLSIDHRERPMDAMLMKKKIRGPQQRHWNFVLAEEQDIETLTKAIDFSWRMDPVSELITHETGVYLVKDGIITRKFPSLDLKESDLTSKVPEGKFFDFKQFCSVFDPRSSKYGPAIMLTLTVTSSVFLLGLLIFILRLKKEGPCN